MNASADPSKSLPSRPHLTADDPGFELQLDSADRYKSLYLENLVENRTRVLSHSWTVGTDRFTMDGVTLRTAF